MRDTARLALTVVCFAVALVAELAALALLLREARRAERALRRWRDTDPPVPVRLVADQLLGNRFDRGAAVVLLVVGLVVGALGNFLGL